MGQKTFKIEVYHRLKTLDFKERTSTINEVLVYDVTFIGLNYLNSLSKADIFRFRDVISRKGLEQFVYVIKEQSDELINNDNLAFNFMTLWDKLELN